MFGPPPGPAEGDAGSVSCRILPSPAAPSATLDAIVLPPFGRNVKYGDVAPVQFSLNGVPAADAPLAASRTPAMPVTTTPKRRVPTLIDRSSRRYAAPIV